MANDLITTPGLTIPCENIAYVEWLGTSSGYLTIYLKSTIGKDHIFVGGDKSFAFWEEYTGQRVSWDPRPLPTDPRHKPIYFHQGKVYSSENLQVGDLLITSDNSTYKVVENGDILTKLGNGTGNNIKDIRGQ